MALYRVAWRLAHDVTWPARRKWTTTAFVDAASAIMAGAAAAAAWTAYLRAATFDTVFCYEVYASDMVPGTDNYYTQSITPGSQRGTIASSGMGEPYLLKACVTTSLNVTGSRPSRKFWRPGLYELAVVNGVGITTALDTAIRNAWAGLCSDETFVDPDGQLYNSVGTLRLGTREFGRYAGNDVPSPPVG